MQNRVEFSLFRCRQKYYEQGERAGRSLAQRVKQQQTQTLIPVIQNEKGETVTDDVEINNSFKSFYQKLYPTSNYHLATGKSPGGDGFPTDFYKSFSDLLAPRLLTVFQDCDESSLTIDGFVVLRE